MSDLSTSSPPDLHPNPEVTASPQDQLHALRSTAAIAPLRSTGWIRVTGSDRVRWLNGMVTNSVQDLKPGDGAYSFLLNVQGRIQGDCTIWAEADALLLETDLTQVEPIITLLDRFIIMDDVELADISGETSGLLIAGPNAAAHLQEIGISVPELPSLHRSTVTRHELPLSLIRADSPLTPRYELWAAPGTIAHIAVALHQAGVTIVGDEALDQLRILEGTPRYGTDIRDKELPQETGQTRALHFNKGCYLGQEIVERIRSRGNVHRTFYGFLIPAADSLQSDASFIPNAPLISGEKAVGEITSIATISIKDQPQTLALGYIRREVLERNQTVTLNGVAVQPASLPFQI